MRAEQVKAAVASYWRYVRQCPIVALEVNSQLGGWAGETADILVVNLSRHLIETEVKVSLADLKRDAKKRKHRQFCGTRSPTTYFYFAVPQEIANKAKPIVDELFPYAGILGCNGDQWSVRVYRSAKAMAFKKLDYTKMLRLVYSQSGTVCRFASRIDELTSIQRKLEDTIKHYRDMERLENNGVSTGGTR